MPGPTLYGLHNSNRKGDDLWGKNQFNSTFPASLACFMRDNGIPAVYLKLTPSLAIKPTEIPIADLFGTESKDVEFHFEERFVEYRKHVEDPEHLEKIDLVTKINGKELRPIEVKLTVIPDSTTVNKTEDYWAPEMVIRPATMIYCALSIYRTSLHLKLDLKQLFYERFKKIRDWSNQGEVKPRLLEIFDAVDDLAKRCVEHQTPTLMQPIWKTKGQSPILCDDAFDIFVWSDLALTRLFQERARQELQKNDASISRLGRASVRLACFMSQAGSKGKADLEHIYRGIAYDTQTDKEFSVQGNKTLELMKCERLTKPRMSKSVLKDIILNGGEQKLNPERRFDQTVFFAASEIFE